MTQRKHAFGRTGRKVSILAIPLFVTVTGTVAAHDGGSYGGGMMGGGWGLFGGAMGLWGLLWMAIIFGVPVYFLYSLFDRKSEETDKQALSVLRERYARGELSDDEYDRRRNQLERTD